MIVLSLLNTVRAFETYFAVKLNVIMVFGVLCAIVPIVFCMGLIRKYCESKWGKCGEFKSLQGKVFIVTGANSGIGKETVKGLAMRKARVILACRNMDSAKAAIEEIRKTITNGELIPMHLDLASLQSVREFAEEILKDFPEIHVLINNAGVSVPVGKNEKTKDGFEINFGVNHLGHFLLTNLLVERLQESVPSRIVIVSSLLHEKGEIDFSNLNGEKGFHNKTQRMNPAYCNSKLANVYFCHELAQRTENTGIDVVVLCPGFCYTGLFRYTNVKWYQYLLFLPVAFFFIRTAAQGAETVIHCAVADCILGNSGQMYRNCKPYISKYNFDPDVGKKLWAVSENMIEKVSL